MENKQNFLNLIFQSIFHYVKPPPTHTDVTVKKKKKKSSLTAVPVILDILLIKFDFKKRKPLNIFVHCNQLVY